MLQLLNNRIFFIIYNKKSKRFVLTHFDGDLIFKSYSIFKKNNIYNLSNKNFKYIIFLSELQMFGFIPIIQNSDFYV